MQADEMALWGKKVHATMPDGLSFIPGSHMVGENLPLQYTFCDTCTPA